MAAPPGEVVGIYLDTRAEIEVGDLVVTGTGRTYEVRTVRRQERGKHAGRWHLRVLVLPELPVDPDARIHRIWWYGRPAARLR